MVSQMKFNLPACSLFSRLLFVFEPEKTNVCVEQHSSVNLLSSNSSFRQVPVRLFAEIYREHLSQGERFVNLSFFYLNVELTN